MVRAFEREEIAVAFESALQDSRTAKEGRMLPNLQDNVNKALVTSVTTLL
jgi:hypothetical protein